jgi:hypothetical protein
MTIHVALGRITTILRRTSVVWLILLSYGCFVAVVRRQRIIAMATVVLS